MSYTLLILLVFLVHNILFVPITVPFARDAGLNGFVPLRAHGKQAFTIPTRAPVSLLGDQLVGKTAGH